ncbi:hypothetical protein LQV05_000253 [Cryptococcus neoformans]|nr:hypothetical protein LQV05_000253 [Cryptococcus neoformans]
MGIDNEVEGARITLGSKEERGVRMACKVAADILKRAGDGIVKPGITTAQVDKAIHEMIIEHGAYPSPLGYSNYPKSCTTSVNNVIMVYLTSKSNAGERKFDTNHVRAAALYIPKIS